MISLSSWWLLTILDRPKSTILMSPRGELLVSKMFCGCRGEETSLRNGSSDLLETACLSQCSDLQVQVDHTVLVEEGHSLQDLPHQPLDLLLAEGLVL